MFWRLYSGLQSICLRDRQAMTSLARVIHRKLIAIGPPCKMKNSVSGPRIQQLYLALREDS